MSNDLKNRRAKYDVLHATFLHNAKQAHRVKEKRFWIGQSRAVLDIVELLDQLIADGDHATSEATESVLYQVRAHAIASKERQNQPGKNSYMESLCKGYRLGYDLIVKDLDSSGSLDRIQEGIDQVFPLTPETLRQLPSFVAAIVRDYGTRDKSPCWSLREIPYDMQSLDAIPLSDDATCDRGMLWTQGWVWRRENGTLSLRPHSALDTAFAWIVEHVRANEEIQIRVWRIRCQESQTHETRV